MKNLLSIILLTALVLQLQAVNIPGEGELQKETPVKGTMTVSSTPDLHAITSKWAGEFTADNPRVTIKVVGLDEAGADLSFVSGNFNRNAKGNTQWKTIVGRDVVVPVISGSNPLIAEIGSKGISIARFSEIFKQKGSCTWSNLLDGVGNAPVNFYLMDNTSVTEKIAGFTGLEPSLISGMPVAGGAEMIDAIRKDPNGIGFCKLTDLLAAEENNQLAGIAMMPIDKNANGRLDYVENIYGNLADLSRGIWIGKYPEALCGNIYAVSVIKPENQNENAFLRYILTAGQATIETGGFTSLANSERLSKIDHLPGAFQVVQASEGVNMIQLIITILAGLVILIAIISFVIRYRAINKPARSASGDIRRGALSMNTLTMPKGVLYDKTHTWTFMEKDGTVRIGIDDFLQHVTGTITSIKFKLPGEKVIKGEPILTLVQHGKRLHINSPVSGIILADNSNVVTDATLVNSAPFGEGWIYKLEPTNWVREIQFLLRSDNYGEWIRTEFTRLKDFLAQNVKPEEPEYAYVILQDGGEIADSLLENLPPEIWEDFQTQFIDSSK